MDEVSGFFWIILWLGVPALGAAFLYGILRNRGRRLKRPDNQASETSDAVLRERAQRPPR